MHGPMNVKNLRISTQFQSALHRVGYKPDCISLSILMGFPFTVLFIDNEMLQEFTDLSEDVNERK
jgi:hypothetical protein